MNNSISTKTEIGQGLRRPLAEWLLEFRRIDLSEANLHLLAINQDGQGVAVVDCYHFAAEIRPRGYQKP